MRYTLVFVGAATLALGCGGATSAINGDGGGGNGADGGPRGPAGSVVENGGNTGTVDAGPGGTTSGLPCGTATCAIPGETCCVTVAGNVSSFACVAGSSCPQVGANDAGGDDGRSRGNGNNNGGGGDPPAVTALQCTGAANCPAGTVCCAVSTNNGGSSSCVPSCGRNDVQLCDPAAASTGCSPAAPCSTSGASDLGLPPSFGICGASN